MSGRRLPEGYNEIGRWTLNQASVKELLLLGLVGLFRLLCGALRNSLCRRDGDRLGRSDDRRGNILLWIAVGGRSRSHTARSRTRRLLPGLRRPAALRVQAVDQVRGWYSTPPPPGATSTGLGTLAAGLSPAVLLTSVLAVALTFVAEDDLLASVVTWAFVLNVAGSSGDMVMMRKVMSYPRSTCFEDTGDGLVAYGPAGSLESP